MRIESGFVTQAFPFPLFLAHYADQSHYSGMQTRAQGGYVDPGWGEKAKLVPPPKGDEVERNGNRNVNNNGKGKESEGNEYTQ